MAKTAKAKVAKVEETEVNQVKAVWLWLKRHSRPVLVELRRHWRRYTLATLGGLLLLWLIGVVGIYGLGWQNPYADAVSRITPLPAARVGGQTIWYHNYYQVRQDLGRANQKAGSPASGDQLNQQAIQTLTSSAVLNKTAQSRQVSVSNKQVDDYINQQAAAMGGMDQVKAALKASGYSLTTYRTLVQRALLQQQLQASLSKGQTLASLESITQGNSKPTYWLPQLRRVEK